MGYGRIKPPKCANVLCRDYNKTMERQFRDRHTDGIVFRCRECSAEEEVYDF